MVQAVIGHRRDQLEMAITQYRNSSRDGFPEDLRPFTEIFDPWERSEAILDLILIDMGQRARSGPIPTVEYYCARYPEVDSVSGGRRLIEQANDAVQNVAISTR